MIGYKIKEVRERLGIPKSVVMERTGIPRSTLTQYENGRTKPSEERLKAIADALGVPVETLIIGGKEDFILINVYNEWPKDGSKVVGVVPARVGNLNEKWVAVKLQDDSLSPLCRQGDVILVKLTHKYKDRDLVVLEGKKGVVMGRMFDITKGGWVIGPVNPDRDIKFLSSEDYSVVGVVKECRRYFE